MPTILTPPYWEYLAVIWRLVGSRHTKWVGRRLVRHDAEIEFGAASFQLVSGPPLTVHFHIDPVDGATVVAMLDDRKIAETRILPSEDPLSRRMAHLFFLKVENAIYEHRRGELRDRVSDDARL